MVQGLTSREGCESKAIQYRCFLGPRLLRTVVIMEKAVFNSLKSHVQQNHRGQECQQLHLHSCLESSDAASLHIQCMFSVSLFALGPYDLAAISASGKAQGSWQSSDLASKCGNHSQHEKFYTYFKIKILRSLRKTVDGLEEGS